MAQWKPNQQRRYPGQEGLALGASEGPKPFSVQRIASDALLLRFSIFLSSPGDVTDERNLARRIIKEELPYDPFLRGKVMLDAVSWDDPAAPTPLDAHLTPQEAINRKLPKPSECDAVVVILWSRMGTPLADYKENGEQYLSGTEWEFEDALQSASKPCVLVYVSNRKLTLDPDDVQFEDKIKQYRLVRNFLSRFKKPDGSLRAHKHYLNPSDFAELFRGDIRNLLQERLEALPFHFSPPGVKSIDTALPWQGSPYPGLRPFSPEEVAIFFGRGREVDELILRLNNPEQRILAIVGTSGTGKSSLIRAGLVPRLEQNAVPGSKDWLVIEFTPGELSDNPFLPLAARLYTAQSPNQKLRAPRDIARELRNNPSSILDVASGLLLHRPKWSKLMVFIDQFEELFTAEIEHYAEDFINSLETMVSDERIKIVLTLRGDFFSRSTEKPGLAELMQSGIFTLAPPGPAAMRDMIIRPAERAGLVLEEGLADSILADAGTSSGALPLVAFALAEMYRISQPSTQLTCSMYDQMGRLKGAIAGRAGQVMARLSSEVQGALPRVFQGLIRLDHDSATRRRVDRTELAVDEATSQLLDALITARLLQTDERDGHSIVEVAHESVFEGWPQLRDWLQENWRFLVHREDLEAKAKRWASEDHQADFLLPPGRQLDEALELVEQRPDLLRPGMRAFVQASWEHEQVRIRAERTQEQERRETAERLKAEAESERNRALYAQARLRADQVIKLTAAGDAEAAVKLALEALPSSLKQPDRPYVPDAEAALYCALSHYRSSEPRLFRTTTSNEAAAGRSSARSDAILDVTEDGRRSWDRNLPTLQTNWINDIQFSPCGEYFAYADRSGGAAILKVHNAPMSRILDNSGEVLVLSYTPNGQHIILGCADGTIQMCNCKTGRRRRLLRGHEGPILSLSSSSDGSRLATASLDGSARLWNIATGKHLAVMALHTDRVVDVCFSPDGERVITASWDHFPRLWNGMTGELLSTCQGHEARVCSARFNSYGDLAVTASFDGTARIWNGRTGVLLATLRGHSEAVLRAIFGRDSSCIITVSRDRTSRIWDPIAGDEKVALPGHEDDITDVCLSPDGNRLITISEDCTARLWDVRSGMELTAFRGHEDAVHRAVFSPTGRFVLTGSRDGTARLWSLLPSGQELIDWARSLV
jgi:WD40 repeat protein